MWEEEEKVQLKDMSKMIDLMRSHIDKELES